MTDVDVLRGFGLAEEAALKAKLSNIVVSTRNGSQRAKVWYGMPSGERERSYPFITIDLIDIDFANERAMSAQITDVDYWPSEYATFEEYAAANSIEQEEGDSARAMWFHPYTMTFQVATHARSAQQDREMMRTLLHTAYLPMRLGYLDVPADASVRHLTTVDWTSMPYFDKAGERVFRTVYTVTVTADMAPENPFVHEAITSVHTELTVSNDGVETEEWDTPAP